MTSAQPTSLHQLRTIKKISSEIQELNQIPLFGHAPPFDWDRFSTLISERFGLNELSFHIIHQEWLPKDLLSKNLNQDLTIFPIDLSPLLASVYWIMSEQDIKKLTSWMLSEDASSSTWTSDLLREGFYRYLLLETLDAATSIEPLQNFTPILHEETPLPEDELFCIDITLQYKEKSCSGRLAIPKETRASWVQHFSRQDRLIPLPKSLESFEINVGIKTGSISLRQSDWELLKKGDFVLLDQGSYDPQNGNGLALLTIGNTPLFQLSIKKHRLHILNDASTYPSSGEKPMEDSTAPKEATKTIQETPLNITVELARLQMTLGELMQLSPGNLLELPIEPDQDVTLSVNGRQVGKAELVYLGQRLGVRITELG